MFNLIMKSVDDWSKGRETISIGRIFEYTDEHISNLFRQDGNLLFDQLTRLPCLFMQEGMTDETVYVGQINRARIAGKEIAFECSLNAEVPSLKNSMIYAKRMELGYAP